MSRVSRRRFLAMAGMAFVSGPARAQKAPIARRIGYLVQSPLIEPPSGERAAFLDELQKLGWTPGRNLHIEYRSAENEPEFLGDLATELVKSRVEIIVAASGTGAAAAKAASGLIPIVFTQHPDPVGAGLVRSLAQPGGNATGLSFVSPDLAGKRIQMLREVLPGARRIAMIWASYVDDIALPEVRVTLASAKRVGLKVETKSIESAEALVRWFQSIERSRPDALLVLADLKMVSYRDILVEHSQRLKIPLIAGWGDIVRAGALLSYSAKFSELFRRSAHYVDKILKGAKPGDLPVEQPTEFELVVNLKTASALGLTIPQSVFVRADEVIR